MTNKKPNIIVIMADQLAPHFTSAYGCTAAHTPNMDIEARRGMRFNAAYCNSPLCAPSRFSFMSGQLISRIAAYDNASEFKASVPTFAHYMQNLGYKTCLSGKMHFIGPDQMHGFAERITTDIYPSDFAWTPDWEAADERIDKWYHNMQTVKTSGIANATFQIDYDDEVAFAAQRWLFNFARDKKQDDKKNDNPFLMVASFIHPHDPYVARKEWWDIFENKNIPMPNSLPLEKQDAFSKRIMQGIEADIVPLTPEEIYKARRAYFANVAYFDSKIGLLIQTLKEIGEYENTVIVITADHGDMLGERGLWYKMNFFEHSARVPLIISGTNIKHGTCDNACSLLDLLPTFIEIGGGNENILAEPIDGASLLGLAQGNKSKDGGKDEAIGEYCAEMTPHPVFMIRRGHLKYIHCDIDPPQLYDLSADAGELKNLATTPAYAKQATDFANEVKTKWNSQKLRQDIIATQKARRLLHEAMQQGSGEAWDYNPPSDASQQYVRNHMDWTVAAARYRYPPVDEE